MIYVDALTDTTCPHFPRACHMFSDRGEGELHEFAAQIGLKRGWFQEANLPHYDLSPRMREYALQAGAREADRQKVVECIHLHRLNASACIEERADDLQ